MKKILGAAVAAAALLSAAGSANATIALGYAAPYNSEAVLVAWDEVAKKSVIVDTGVHFNDIYNAVNDGNDATTFSANLNIQAALTAAFGSNLSNVKWNVAQFSRQNATTNPALGFSHQGTFITTNVANPTPGSLTNASIQANITSYREFFNTTVDTAVGNSATESVNNYYVAADDTANTYGGDDRWGDRARLTVPFDTFQAGAGALNYYFLGLTVDGANAQMYQVGSWNLNLATGALSFASYQDAVSEVPVPAAAWLLVSGLAGLGTVARRRKQA